jgi:hypothetical protein
MRRFTMAVALAGSMILTVITSVFTPDSASAARATTVPSSVTCTRLVVNYKSQILTVSGCNGPKGFNKATGGDFQTLWDSGQTDLTWSGGTVVEVSIPTVTTSPDYCPEPPPWVGNKLLYSVIAVSGGGLTANICVYDQYHRSNGWRLVLSLVSDTVATVTT